MFDAAQTHIDVAAPHRTAGDQTRLLMARIRIAIADARSRRALHQADDAMLKDLGISRAQAEFQASRR